MCRCVDNGCMAPGMGVGLDFLVIVLNNLYSYIFLEIFCYVLPPPLNLSPVRQLPV